MGVKHNVVVHENELDAYRKNLDRRYANIIQFDETYKQNYPLESWELPWDVKNVGPGAERNFVWDLAKAEGSVWHWVLDDNIRVFAYINTKHTKIIQVGKNKSILTGYYGDIWNENGSGGGEVSDWENTFPVVEKNTVIWRNVGMSCMQSVRTPIQIDSVKHPYRVNVRCFSACFIRNAAPFHWRCRYNEDLILSLDMILH
jgi:hypothetical protein